MQPHPSSLPPEPVIEAYKKDIDRTLLRENLKLSVQERFEKHMSFQRFAEELRQAGKEATAGRSKDLEPIAELDALAEERASQNGA